MMEVFVKRPTTSSFVPPSSAALGTTTGKLSTS